MIMNESKDGCAWGEVLSSTQCTELACTTALQLSVMARLRLRRFEAAAIQVQSESGRRSDQLGHNIWRRYATGRRWRPRMEPGTAGRSSSRYDNIIYCEDFLCVNCLRLVYCVVVLTNWQVKISNLLVDNTTVFQPSSACWMIILRLLLSVTMEWGKRDWFVPEHTFRSVLLGLMLKKDIKIFIFQSVPLSQLVKTHVPTIWAIDQYRIYKDVRVLC